MGPELIDDWGDRPRVKAEPGNRRSVPRAGPAMPQAIQAALADFKPPIEALHCYEDVGHPWVQVAFGVVISPDVALAVGDALADVAGRDNVYLNSLRPKAVYFLLQPAFEPRPALPVSRYGAPLEDVRTAWRPASKGTAKRTRKSTQSSARQG